MIQQSCDKLLCLMWHDDEATALKTFGMDRSAGKEGTLWCVSSGASLSAPPTLIKVKASARPGIECNCEGPQVGEATLNEGLSSDQDVVVV